MAVDADALLFRSNAQPMWIYDLESLRILAVNEAAVEEYGYSPEEFLELRMTDINAPEEIGRLLGDLAAGLPARGQSAVWVHRRRDGRLVPVEVTSRGYSLGSREAALVTARDMTVEQRITRSLWTGEDRFRLLVEHSSDLILVIGRDRKILYATPASATVLGFDPGSLIGQAAISMVHSEDWARSLPNLAEFMRTPGGNIQLEVRVRHADGHWVALEAHCRNLLTAPSVQGVVVNTRDVTQRKAAEEKVKQVTQDLQESYDRTLEGWVRAVDLRDRETKGHTDRVTQLTVQLAERLGFPSEDLAQVRRGALLHDIGKIAIPDEVLLKPASLTEEEWEVMRLHPLYAYEFLYPIPHLRAALDIPLYHHEKWDGGGYPYGLKGTNIPLAARMFALVDVWDALRSERPYRRPWTSEQALEHIRQGSGTHFDPEIVRVFLQMIEDMNGSTPIPIEDRLS